MIEVVKFSVDEHSIQALAFDAGSWLENAFGSRHRRYLAHSGRVTLAIGFGHNRTVRATVVLPQ